MARPDVSLLRRSLSESSRSRLQQLEVFSSIASTNTHLLSQPPPAAGRLRIALADHQTSGRGRHSSRWLSAPGAGLCLSVAYTFETAPGQLPALTLAIGTGIVDSLGAFDVDGVLLKWPNDIVAENGKLGGILTEVQSAAGKAVTVVTGIGLNLDLSHGVEPGFESGWALQPVDLASLCSEQPPREAVAATVVNAVHATATTFAARGFGAFADAWRQRDWLRDREIEVDTPEGLVAGIARGVDDDGALIVENNTGRQRIINGSIVSVAPQDAA